ncbi:MAG: hypothetical protein UT32_C0012G0016 [Parcubacteria group bacterium GW2011_GWC2_39_14]|nr:MAG: hypothetical protein UT32_C0012G0016 [Parcubacteria group bacterium GW2011_GWC2_39_14]KKR55187.1 MAG: hypothetical protein UT91_C0004G0086 [Parcubacteria group bacterium GW2011_GWA2_40_23]
MSKGQKTKSEKSLLFKFVFIFLLLLIIVLAIGSVREYLRQKELNKEMVTLQEDIKNLNLEKNQFLSSIEAYKSEFFVEQEARLKFNLQKSGEKVLVIPQGGSGGLVGLGGENDLAEAQSASTRFYVNNVRAWGNYFFQAR